MHMRVSARLHSPCTCVCACVFLKCAWGPCHVSLQLFRCARLGHTVCVYLFHALRAQVCPIRGCVCLVLCMGSM